MVSVYKEIIVDVICRQHKNLLSIKNVNLQIQICKSTENLWEFPPSLRETYGMKIP
jgi:hypothetical protein